MSEFIASTSASDPLSAPPAFDVRAQLGIPDQGVLVGIDEVGRGCLAGPVDACAFAFRTSGAIAGLRDSKKLSAKRRQALVEPLSSAGWFAYGRAECREIDELGILPATNLAMRRALMGLLDLICAQPTTGGVPSPRRDHIHVVVDGSILPIWQDPQDLGIGSLQALVRADDLVPEVSAASVLAKVRRDAHMLELDAQFPGYGFAAHAGYGTEQHMRAIDEMGGSAEHRFSFAPLKATRTRAIRP